MANYDVFNGDADGICALLQLHLQQRAENISNTSQLVTGVKRDINLLKKIPADGIKGHLNILDISLDKNRDELVQLLAQGYSAFYADHHYAGEIPEHPKLTALIDTASDTCTSLIVNQYLEQKHYPWAIVGAYGDNLFTSAERLAQQHGLSEQRQSALKELGTLINYNGYGAQVSDLHFPPDQLFLSLLNYSTPDDFISAPDSDFKTLQSGYADDIQLARNTPEYFKNASIAVTILADAMWSRRVSGVFSNELANQAPNLAHAVLTPLADKSAYLVGIRAPLNNKTGADELCRQFPTGGGRKAAAGINQLSEDQLTTFIDRFSQQYGK